jgi:hypothetical protein
MKDVLQQILDIDNNYLDSIDLNLYMPYTQQYDVPKHWFYEKSGQEHYRLLIYISYLYENQTLLDVGTYHGSSALALSMNSSNQIKSFDLIRQPELNYINESNIEFKLENILENNDELILSAPFIMLDTDHDGPFEYAFYNHLKKINYKGLLFLDDINLNDPMKGFWNHITEEKHELTSKGHWSGTGIVKM